MSTPVVPGEKYLLSFDYAGVGSSISRVWRVQVYFRDTEGNFLSLETNDQTVTTTTWTETTREITVPSGAAVIYLVRIRAVASGSSNQIYITNVRLRNISSGVLIEDGSITANKIITGGIDAQDLIVDGTITGVLIQGGTIEADKIKLDYATIDTDGSGNLIVSDNGIDFEQLVDKSASDYELYRSSVVTLTNGVNTSIASFFTMDHDGDAMIQVIIDIYGSTTSSSSASVEVQQPPPTTIYTRNPSGSATSNDPIIYNWEMTGLTAGSSYNRQVKITTTNFTSPSVQVTFSTWKRYR
jgi:hypothetical protein